TNYLPGSRGQTIEKLWRDFFSLYKLMRSKDELADATINKFEIDARNWVSTFCQPTLKKATGEIIQEGIYQRQDVTPYMHVLACHIPAFMRLLKSEGLKLRYFSSSSLEKKNHQH
ncbi:41050_t:CDS:1, partial [Gigaspora margarita]